MKKLFLFLLVITSLFCSRFKVDKLEADLLFTVPIDEGGASLSFPKQHGIYYSVPSRVGISGDWLVVSEPSKKRVKIYKDKNLSVVIAKESESEESGGTTINAPYPVEYIESSHLDIPGIVIAGKDDDFYVVNYSPAKAGAESPESVGFYKIVHFDMKGNFLNLIGRKGRVELPFESIQWMDIDSENRLWVLHTHLGELILDQFSEGNNILTYSQKDCEGLLFSEQDKEENVLSVCELMYPTESGEEILMVGKTERVADRKSDKSNYAFLYRKFLFFNYRTLAKNIVFEKLNDPEDYPYIPYGNSLFIWRTINTSRIRLGIYTNEGDITKSLQVDLFGKRPNWRSLYATLSGKVIGIRIFNHKFEVYEWR